MIRRFENEIQNFKIFDYKRFIRKERDQMWINKIERFDFILDLILFSPITKIYQYFIPVFCLFELNLPSWDSNSNPRSR